MFAGWFIKAWQQRKAVAKTANAAWIFRTLNRLKQNKSPKPIIFDLEGLYFNGR
jgi:hypothetical protein